MRGSRSARLEPAQRALARCKPGGRKYRRAVDRLPPARFHGAGERRGHVKRELPDTGGAVARDDRVVAPLHYAVAEAVAEFGGVDQQERWTDFFRLGGEQRLSFPKIPSAGDSRDKAESAHHSIRCLRSSNYSGRSSPTCSGRRGSLKSRISFSGISSISPCAVYRTVCSCAGVTEHCWYG